MENNKEYNKDNFHSGKNLYYILDMNQGTFKILNNEHELLATSKESLKGKKVVPYVNI